MLDFFAKTSYNKRMTYIIGLLASFLAVMIVITLHEFAHAYVANKCGDPTAKLMGRLTLNPVKHFDLLGIAMFAIAGFGWANPVPVNPYNFKNYTRGCVLTAAAGVIVNYLSAFLFYPLYLLFIIHVFPAIAGKNLGVLLLYFFVNLWSYSLNFCVFNLLPFYPLDGFRILDAVDKKRGKVFTFLRYKGHLVLLGLILLSIIAERIPGLAFLNILGYVMSFATNILGKPITLFWNMIFNI